MQLHELSELKIQGELNLPGAGSGNRPTKSGYGSQTWAEHRIDLGDIRTVEKVEEFRYYVETSRRFTPPNGKYFSMRKSIVASAGVRTEFLPRPSGLAERGKA